MKKIIFLAVIGVLISCSYKKNEKLASNQLSLIENGAIETTVSQTSECDGDDWGFTNTRQPVRTFVILQNGVYYGFVNGKFESSWSADSCRTPDNPSRLTLCQKVDGTWTLCERGNIGLNTTYQALENGDNYGWGLESHYVRGTLGLSRWEKGTSSIVDNGNGTFTATFTTLTESVGGGDWPTEMRGEITVKKPW